MNNTEKMATTNYVRALSIASTYAKTHTPEELARILIGRGVDITGIDVNELHKNANNTSFVLHKNVKILASTYSAIALTMAMEEVMGGAPHPINWDDMDAIKADIEARRKQLEEAKFIYRGVEGKEAFFDHDAEDVLRYRDNFEMVKAANTDEMQGPLTLAPLHDMMDEYYNRIMGNETIKAIIARGNVKDDGRAHFEECKAKIANV